MALPCCPAVPHIPRPTHSRTVQKTISCLILFPQTSNIFFPSLIPKKDLSSDSAKSNQKRLSKTSHHIFLYFISSAHIIHLPSFKFTNAKANPVTSPPGPMPFLLSKNIFPTIFLSLLYHLFSLKLFSSTYK